MAKGRFLVVVAFACTATLLFASAATAATRVVHQGQSIQAAIDAANPGDTILVEPGVYHENLTITKDRITLRAQQGRGSVVLEPGAKPTPSDCVFDPSAVPGICIHGQFTQTGLGEPVRGTGIDRFVVSGFSDFGILLLNANDSTVMNTEAKNNKAYGISGFVLSGIRFVNNLSHDNGDPGFYIGDSPRANAWVSGNKSWRNGVGGEGFGFLFRDSSLGTVVNNSAWDNCAGFVFVDSGEDPAPFANWSASGNSALHNNGECPGGGGPPPTSGIGFVLLGTHHVVLRANTAKQNHPTGPSIPSGGIVVLSSKAFGGADPTDNVIERNVALDNNPFDIFWDGSGSGNTFSNNICKTSQPAWICGL